MANDIDSGRVDVDNARVRAEHAHPLGERQPAPHWIAGLLVSLILIVHGSLTLADHEVDHRYTVTGYVLNADESPVPSATVLIRADSTGQKGKTDETGYYSLILHLHNSDLGRELHITTDYGKGTVHLAFDPSDRSTPRIHHVNFVGGRMIEGELQGMGRIPNWVYYLAGLLFLVTLVTFLGKPAKTLVNRLSPAAPAEPGKKARSAKTRSKSRKRRKRH